MGSLFSYKADAASSENYEGLPGSPATAQLTVKQSTGPLMRVKLLHIGRGVPGFILRYDNPLFTQ